MAKALWNLDINHEGNTVNTNSLHDMFNEDKFYQKKSVGTGGLKGSD